MKRTTNHYASKGGNAMNKYSNIRQNLINTINEVTKEIYSLDELSQAQIFNDDIIPEQPDLLFLNNCYYCLYDLLTNLSILSESHE